MTPTRAQLDAAEARLLKEWCTLVRHRRHVRIELAAKRPFVVAATLQRCDEARAQVATAIRAIRAMRKALVCVMCGETIRPGTMNGYECSLTREGWLCGALSHAKHAVGDEP